MREEQIWPEASGLAWRGKFCRRMEREGGQIAVVPERRMKGHWSGSEARSPRELIRVCWEWFMNGRPLWGFFDAIR